MDERGRLGVKRCAEKRSGYQTGLFSTTEPEWVEVDVKSVRVERSRKIWRPLAGKSVACAGWNWIASWKKDYRTDARKFLGRQRP